MTDIDKLIERLRDCANGFGDFKTDTGDFGLCADTADTLTALQAENARLREALERVAAFNDYAANKHLQETGSYSCFDNPGPVEVARAALQGGDDANAQMD